MAENIATYAQVEETAIVSAQAEDTAASIAKLQARKQAMEPVAIVGTLLLSIMVPKLSDPAVSFDTTPRLATLHLI